MNNLRLTLLLVGLLAASPVVAGELYECAGGLYTDHRQAGCKKLDLQENRITGAEFHGAPSSASDRPAAAVAAAQPERTDASYDSAEECALYHEYLDLMQQGGNVGSGISPDKFMRQRTLSRMFGPSLYGGGRHPHCP